ncbi:NfeD family protein [Marinomonas sp. 15G1-11]|uniref:NfeD family protein n=1 Tax=Marinomonas phaeophyticola TaxID=3004091 RepID=A0ABT4JT60_9GAMM|nr:NfeD family protein [Marinomonas sp. 15G1-11]MCZ2721410.1 NfeD family protein [Marinomonas sp. 15G1-11]
MFDFISNNIAHSMIALGIVLLIVEVLVLGFSTFVLFFLGLSFIITGGLMLADILPVTFSSILLSNALACIFLALVLWKPLKKMQDNTETKTIKSDFTGIQLTTIEEISDTSTPEYKYSGIMWKLKSTELIPENTRVEVIKAEVGTFWVKAI